MTKISNHGCLVGYKSDLFIEVNLSPALSIDVQTDLDVKRPLLEDLIDLIDLSKTDAIQARKHATDKMSQPLKTRDRRSSLSSINSKKSLKISDNDTKYPEKQGLWIKIYPYDSYSQSQTSPVKIGDTAMKTLVKNIKSSMI